MSSSAVLFVLAAAAVLSIVGVSSSISAKRSPVLSRSDGELRLGVGRDNTPPLVVLAFLEFLAFLLAIGYGLGDPVWNVRLSLILLGITAAASAVGSLLGFLFGIPRFTPVDNRLDAGDPASRSAASGLAILAAADAQDRWVSVASYRPSTNLDDIADWLTKIIVGVGLTQLTLIGPALARIGVATRANCGSACPSDAAISSLILSGSILSFLYAYIWTRLHYNKLAARSDRETLELLQIKQDKDSVEKFGVGGRVHQYLGAAGSFASGADLDDPNKGEFGGLSSRNDRVVSAVVEPVAPHQYLYRITLTVASANRRNALVGTVDFHLHPTFRETVVTQEVKNGLATLVLIAYGAFTVGVVADRGETRLELDLAELAGAPMEFRLR